MGLLSGKKCYLSAPIEFGGEGWREEPKKILTEQFGINLFDPFCDPKQQWVPAIKEAKLKKDYETIRMIARKFVSKDLEKVDKTDFLVAYLPYKVPSSGMGHEIINSNNMKKPTLLVTNQDCISYIPTWYWGFIRIEYMFAGWGDLYKYLEEVDAGKHANNERWNFLYDN